LNFLGWEEADEEHFGQDVRIVLVSGDFSKELTTSVLWLNERDLDVLASDNYTCPPTTTTPSHLTCT
ncbi:MAG: hypothetical protein DRQ54_10765, partial [Gammaproteobacteria bacterium]